MSIIFKGDIISNFGRYLPAPFIRHATLTDNGVDVEISVYINIIDGQDVKATIDDLSNKINLGFYVTFNPGHYEKVVDNKVNIFYYYVPTEFSITRASTSWTDKDMFIPLDNIFESSAGMASYTYLVNEELYDENGNQIWEFRYTQSIKYNDDLVHAWDSYWYQVGAETDGHITATAGLYLGAFSTTLNLNNDSEIMSNLENMPLLKTKISDISYETVISDIPAGQTAEGPPGSDAWNELKIPGLVQTEFLDMNDAIYDSIPLQTLDSRYHKTDHITHKNIVIYFKELLEEFKAQGAKRSRLQKMMNQISHVLEVYGDKVDLIPQLNFLRSVFPSKSTAVPVGKLYRRFRKRIATVNDSAKRGSKLRKRQIRNTKMQDGRTKPIATYLAPSIAVPEASIRGHNYTYFDVVDDNGYSGTVEYDYDTRIYTNYGFFFFDYEKALRQTSVIAQAYDLKKLQELLGITIPYSMFYYSTAEIKRCESFVKNEASQMECKGKGIKIVSYMTDDSNSVSENPPKYPQTKSIKAVNTSGIDDRLVFPYAAGITKLGGYAAESDLYGFDESVEMPMLVVRAPFMPEGPRLDALTGIENYKLTLFEYQDYYRQGPSERTEERYGCAVVIVDNTIEATKILESTYADQISLLGDYLELVSSYCFTNNITGEFNSYFTDILLSMYASDPNSAPWHSAAMVYAIYQDIAFDTFGGNISDINTYAMEIVEKINPYGGSAESIQTFYNDMVSLQDSLYGKGENSINSVLSGLPKDARELTYSFEPPSSVATAWPWPVTTAAEQCTADDDCDPEQKCWDDGTCVPANYCKTNADCKQRAEGAPSAQDSTCVYNECTEPPSGYMTTTESFQTTTAAARGPTTAAAPGPTTKAPVATQTTTAPGTTKSKTAQGAPTGTGFYGTDSFDSDGEPNF
jgi:hypothetical protein